MTLHTMAPLMLEPKFVDELLSRRQTGREAEEMAGEEEEEEAAGRGGREAEGDRER